MAVLAGCAATGGAGPAEEGRAGGLQREEAPALGAASQSLLEQGRRERESGQLARAAGTLERALRIDTNAPVLWLELARVRLDEGNAAQAEQLGRKARALAGRAGPVVAESNRLIAEALRRQGRHQEAQEVLAGSG